MARRSLALYLSLAAFPGVAAAQVADTLPRLRLHLNVPRLELREPAALRAPWLGAPPASIIALDSAVSAALDSSRIARATALRQASIYGVSQQVTPDAAAAAPERTGAFGLSPKYADLSLDGQATLDVRTERVRNERCTAAASNDPSAGCGGGIRAPRLENQIVVRSSGTLGQRVHVNIDYDADRDFSANNNIQVYYQGLTDEIVRRVEVGTVVFRPPSSRFLTAAVPRSNFGINGLFEVGPMQFQTLFATQKGSAVSERVFTVGGTGTSEPQDRAVRDLDFESGRFFWVIDPQRLATYPAVDILALGPEQLPEAQRPGEVRIYRYRSPTAGSGVNPNLGGIRAFAINSADTTQRLGRPEVDEGVEWELLVQGRDYYLDPSALWITLASKLDSRDYLAVSYLTADGASVGSFPAADNPAAIDTLELIVEPLRGADAGTFRHEMRQIYRVAGNDLQTTSLQVSISLNRSERPESGLGTYLAQLGLAIPNDANVFDRENRLFPRARDPGADEIVRESYLVFPHLEPFSNPQQLTPPERSDSLYRTPLYLLFSQGPPARFQLRLRYEASGGGGDQSSLSLNALQIKEGSEQLLVNGRMLQRGTDYEIDYLTGQVLFSNPESLFGAGAAQVTARFEQQDLFAIAPTTILGLTSTYSLGEMGSVNLIGVFQREATAYNRPQLGFEAKANLIGGVNTDLHFQSRGLTSFLDKLTSAPATAPSRLDINAELAFSRPDPNRSGAAYLEEFETDVGAQLSLAERAWEFGSVPQGTDGLDPMLGFGTSFDPADAVALTWQNLIPTSNGDPFRVSPQDIDTTIVLAGTTDQSETAMFLTLHADTAGGFVRRDNSSRWTLPERPLRPRWRSMVTPLSSTGVDLSRSEYLEFWVYQTGAQSADSAGVQLVIDLGSVNEDALALAPEALATAGTDTLYDGRQYAGVGRLDTERASDGIFNANQDDIGILGDRPETILLDGAPAFDLTLCSRSLTGAVPIFPWGDLSSRCTSGNGNLDTEDLNGDLLLNARGPNESVFRYIVDLESSAYIVPNRGVKTIDTNGREAGWTLYRVPLRTAAAEIGTPNLRLIQHMRITVAAPPDNGGGDVVARFGFARMRFVGAPWVRRAETPIAGIDGSTGEPHGEVLVSIVSTENVELGYTSPPGTANVVNDRNAGQSAIGRQVNEKSLRVIGRGLAVGERAEAYLHFSAGPQNLLNYRELRVWARGYGEGWERGDLQAFVKLGSDDRNFYLYRAPASTTSWEPEMVIDLEVWRRLRGDLEARFLNGDAPSGAAECGGDPEAFVICEGPYLVHLRDPRVNPPNLAAVQEIAAGLLRVADFGALPEAEVWIDDIRLTLPVSELGKALALDARLAASDVGDLSVSFLRQDGHFRQIGETPSYRTNSTMRVAGNWRLDRFLPAALGIAMPATVSFSRTGVDPQLIGGTDIRGAAIDNLRRPSSWSTTYSLAIRRSARGTGWLTRGFIDPWTLIASFANGRAQSELSQAANSISNFAASYNLALPRTGATLDLAGILPGFLRETEAGKALAQTRISFVPSSIRLTSGLARDEGEFTSFQVPVLRAADSVLTPTRSLNHIWRNNAGLTWQPLGMLSLSGDLTSSRDLRHYPDSTAIGRLAGDSRRSFLGMDVGVERDRQFSTGLTLTPRLTSWLRPRYTTRSNFVLSRSLSSRPPVRAGEDTLGAFILPQTLNNNRSRDVGLAIDVARLARGVAGDSSFFTGVLKGVRPLDVSNRLTRTSTYDLAAFEPSLRYQLGLGGRNDFLTQDGVQAIGVGETRSTSLTSGADLPFGISFALTYNKSDTRRFVRLGTGITEIQTLAHDWPVGNVRWSQTFGGGPVTLVGLGATFRQRTGLTTQPTNLGATTNGISSSSFAPDLQVGFRNGMRLAMQLSTSDSRTDNASSSTLSDQSLLFGTFSHSFRMPAWVGRSRKRISATLSGRTDHTVTCLQPAGAAECNTISDTYNQELSAGFRTDLAQTLQGGLDFGYTVSDAKHLNRRVSTMYLTMSFTLALEAGTFR